MSRARTKTGWLAVALAILLLLPISYIGSYYAMLGPPIRWQENGSWQQNRSGKWLPGKVGVSYRIESEFVDKFYFPAHKLDCRLRPERW